MRATQCATQNLHNQPGQIGAGGVRLSVQKRLTRMAVGVHSISIASEQFKSYQGDLDMM